MIKRERFPALQAVLDYAAEHTDSGSYAWVPEAREAMAELTRLRAEVERLTRERDEGLCTIRELRSINVAPGISLGLAQEWKLRAERLESALALAREALEPFRRYNDAREEACHRGADTYPLLIASPKKGATASITEGDLRRAAAALARIAELQLIARRSGERQEAQAE